MTKSSIHEGFSPQTIILTIAATVLVALILIALSTLAADVAGTAPLRTPISVALAIHLATVIPAIPLGAVVLYRRKGDAMHRLLGKAWAGLMLTTAVTTFWLGHSGGGLFGIGLSFIHLFSVLTLFSIPYGIWQARRGNITGHYRAMQAPYIGLIVAGLFAFIPGRLLGGLVF